MPISKKILDAIEVLSKLREGDRVVLSEDCCREYTMTVTNPLHRSDGQFGSLESSRVTVSLGVGRWATDVTAEQMAAGRQKISKAD